MEDTELGILNIRVWTYTHRGLLTYYHIQILHNHVMVRVGGVWDTLQNFLNKHDPCRHNTASDANMVTREGQGPMAAKVAYTRYFEKYHTNGELNLIFSKISLY